MKPCCFYNNGDQCRNIRPDDYPMCLDLGGKLGPEGTCCANPTIGPIMQCPGDVPGGACWLCEHEVTGIIDGPCCFRDLDFQWFVIDPVQCTSCGGDPYVLEGDCQPGPRVQECIYAGEDRPPYEGAPRWTLDTIGTVVFGLVTVTDEWRQFRENFGLPWGQVQGDTYGMSTHLSRPREPDTPVNACGHAVGGLTMLDDGKCYMGTCSLPDASNLDSHRRSFGLLRTFDESDSRIGVEAGRQYWVTCIRNPWWTEALYHSHQRRCESEPV